MEDNYDHCNEALESVAHALWGCLELMQIWNANSEYKFHFPRGLPSISDLLLQAQTEGKNLEHLAMMLWTIWFRRNQIRINNKDYPTSQVAVNAQQALQEFNNANALTRPLSSSIASPRRTWSPPPVQT